MSGIISGTTGKITYNKPDKNETSETTCYKLQYNGEDYNFDEVKNGLNCLFKELSKTSPGTSGLIIANEQTRRDEELNNDDDPNARPLSTYPPEILE